MEVRFTWFACRASLNKLGKHNCTGYFDVKFAGPELDFRTSELGNICAFLILFPNLNIALFCYLFNPLVLWQSDKWLNLCFLRLQTWRHYSSAFHPLFELENLPRGITPLEIPVATDKVNKMVQFQRKGIIFPSDIFLFLWDTGVVVSLNLYYHDDAFISAFVSSRVRF